MGSLAHSYFGSHAATGQHYGIWEPTHPFGQKPEDPNYAAGRSCGMVHYRVHENGSRFMLLSAGFLEYTKSDRFQCLPHGAASGASDF
jgi:hypothetical protein